MHERGKILKRALIALGCFAASVVGIFYLAFVARFQSHSDAVRSERNSTQLRQNSQAESKNQPQSPPLPRPATPVAASTSAKALPVNKGNQREVLSPKFTLELKMFKSKAEADALITKLRARGVHAYYTPYNSRGHVYYRVRQGVYHSQKSAEADAEQFKVAQGLPVTVVKLQ